MGFLREGQLFVTGRIKDLILIRGRNFYPQDIELTVETSHSDLRLGCSAAFACDTGDEEHLVVVQEVRENAAADLRVDFGRDSVGGQRATTASSRGPLCSWPRARSIKTSSGKIARRACRDAYTHQELATLFEWAKAACRRRPSVALRRHRRSAGRRRANRPARRRRVRRKAID